MGNIESIGFESWDSGEYPDYDEKRALLQDMVRRFFARASAEELSVIERLLPNLRKDNRTRHYIDRQYASFSLDGNDDLSSPAIDSPKLDGEFLAVAIISGDREFLEVAREHLFRCTLASPTQRPPEHTSYESEDDASQSEAHSELFLNEEDASRQYAQKREKDIKAVAMDVLDTIPSEQDLEEFHAAVPGIKRALETAPPDMSDAAKQALLDELKEQKDELLQKLSEDRTNPTFAAREGERKAIKQRLRQL